MHLDSKPADPNHSHDFARKVLVALGISTVVLILLISIWITIEVILLTCSAILLAIFLRSLSRWLSVRMHIKEGWALTFLALSFLLAIGLFFWFLAPDLIKQFKQLSEDLPRSWSQIKRHILTYDFGKSVIMRIPGPEDLLPKRSEILTRVAGIFSTTFGALASMMFILVLGLYLAANPKRYTEGIIQLVPVRKRSRVREVFCAIDKTLQQWLLGRILGMVIAGVLIWLGLWAIGIPFALTLGLFTAILEFIPNFGPILAFIPAFLLALLQSPTQALYVLILYLVIQHLVSYLITPILTERTVSLPPAVTIFAQVLLSVLLGALGLILATPFVAVAAVLVRMLYVEDILKDSTGYKN
jgi:predicted PurR-regulated permease PerM